MVVARRYHREHEFYYPGNSNTNVLDLLFSRKSKEKRKKLLFIQLFRNEYNPEIERSLKGLNFATTHKRPNKNKNNDINS